MRGWRARGVLLAATADMQLGMVGLGRMGSGVARLCIAAGHAIVAFDLDAARVHERGAVGARWASSPAELVAVFAGLAPYAGVAPRMEGRRGSLAPEERGYPYCGCPASAHVRRHRPAVSEGKS